MAPPDPVPKASVGRRPGPARVMKPSRRVEARRTVSGDDGARQRERPIGSGGIRTSGRGPGNPPSNGEGGAEEGRRASERTRHHRIHTPDVSTPPGAAPRSPTHRAFKHSNGDRSGGTPVRSKVRTNQSSPGCHPHGHTTRNGARSTRGFPSPTSGDCLQPPELPLPSPRDYMVPGRTPSIIALFTGLLGPSGPPGACGSHTTREAHTEPSGRRPLRPANAINCQR